MNNYKKRFVEVDEILKNLPKQEFDKIPKDIINIIRNNKDSQYIWKYDRSQELTAQKLHIDTVAILSYINIEFLLNENQRKLMKKIHNYNEIQEEKKRKILYNPNKLFNEN